MFGILYIHEIQNYLYSLRFHISFVIILLVFAIGSISFNKSYREIRDNYLKYDQEQQKELDEKSQNVSRLATGVTHYVMTPRANSFVSDCKEQVLPNRFSYNAYNVFGFSVRHNSTNPLMKQAQALNWSFIVSMVLSFMALLFSFDAISGEKEDRTLALVLSNPVSRATILSAKFLGVVTVTGCMMLIGILVSLLIITLSGNVTMSTGLLGETAGFTGISLLFISAMAVIGLLSSVLTRNSNVSLLIALCFWLAFAVVIPNTSVFWANKLFPIPHAEEVNQEIWENREAIDKAAPDGSWSAHGGNPFLPAHELRADLQMKLMNSEKQFKDAYYARMFKQFENTRSFTMLSPMAQFDYLNEAMLGGGYLRFHKNWNDLHSFQVQFLQWFKDLDAKDNKSPHWYNPLEDLSTTRQSVSPGQVPVYTEQAANITQRFSYMQMSLFALVITMFAGFTICFMLLVRYDVR